MRNLLDSVASLGAACLAFLICGIPAWFTLMAVRAEIAPVWAYASAAVLAAVGLVLTFAFGRKAFAGIAPTRQRRR